MPERPNDDHPPDSAAPDPLGSPPRVAALRATGLADPTPSEVLDRLTRTATRLLGVPIALVSLVEERRQCESPRVSRRLPAL